MGRRQPPANNHCPSIKGKEDSIANQISGGAAHRYISSWTIARASGNSLMFKHSSQRYSEFTNLTVFLYLLHLNVSDIGSLQFFQYSSLFQKQRSCSLRMSCTTIPVKPPNVVGLPLGQCLASYKYEVTLVTTDMPRSLQDSSGWVAPSHTQTELRCMLDKQLQ